MDPLSIIGAGVGLIGGIGKLFGAGKANRRLSQLQREDPTYKANPLAGQRLAYAQQLMNARMPGAAAAERNIYGNQAGALGGIQRNATDSSQALALAAGVQGQTNQAFEQLGQQENQDYMGRVNNLTGAQQGSINESDKVYQDEVRRWQDKAQIQGAQTQNTSNMWESLSNLGFAGMNFGMAGGFSGGLGGGGTQTTYSDIPRQRGALK